MPVALTTSLGCLHPIAQVACITIILVGAVLVLVITLRGRRVGWQLALAWVALFALATWFGSLRYSPLRFGSARLPVLQGFEIRRPNRAPIIIASGKVVSASPGLPLVIHPQTLPVRTQCQWSASAGGALDDPRSCDTTYAAPAGAPFEILRLRLQPACGLPPAVAQIKISILP